MAKYIFSALSISLFVCLSLPKSTKEPSNASFNTSLTMIFRPSMQKVHTSIYRMLCADLSIQSYFENDITCYWQTKQIEIRNESNKTQW